MRFTRIFARSSRLSVVGMAEDGDVAIKRIVELNPDIVLLDLMMPRMDGFGVLRWAMETRPIPIVVCSSFSDRDRVFKALELGAVDFLLKPTPRSTPAVSTLEEKIIRRVEEAALARPSSVPKTSADEMAQILKAEQDARNAEVEVICIAASTGGPAAIQRLVAHLPKRLSSPIIIVQHMPFGFTAPFAERLNSLSHYKVQEASDMRPILKGNIYIAPAGMQTTITGKQGEMEMRVRKPVTSDLHAPSADALFESASMVCEARTLALVLTGMGEDGARGAEIVRRAGGHVIVESNETAVVFGMPRSVIERGCANAMLPLQAMPQMLLAYTLKD